MISKLNCTSGIPCKWNSLNVTGYYLRLNFAQDDVTIYPKQTAVYLTKSKSLKEVIW